jgi:hypothetical protein
MNQYVVVQVWDSIKDLSFRFTTNDKENAISVLKKFREINDIENGDKQFEIFVKVKILK